MLADFLFGALRTRVLSILFLQPDTACHVRELARRLDALPGSTNRELAKAGILSRQRIGNQVHYRYVSRQLSHKAVLECVGLSFPQRVTRRDAGQVWTAD